MEQVTVINIYWNKVEFNFNKVKEFNRDFHRGLYQVYGQHPAYGDEALLYIGKAVGQSFGERLDQRWDFIYSSSRPTFIRLGLIVQHNKPDEEIGWDVDRWHEIIDISEKILIKAHSPALNQNLNTGIFTSDVKEFKNQHFLINNWGDFGKLLPEVSTLRFSYKYTEFETPIGFKS